MQKRQAGTARGGKTGPRGRERLAEKMKQGGIRAPEGRAFSGIAKAVHKLLKAERPFWSLVRTLTTAEP